MKNNIICSLCLILAFHVQAQAQQLSVGGYGEIALSRNFYSDNVYRYSSPSQYANDPSHGRFDIPHAVIYLGYDFGKGWSMQTEIEFEHTGTGSAVEKEFTEAGEWETEIEKGGEVELEQFWLQKSFSNALNLRIGHIGVPVGGLNNAHEPLNFFTVYRPEGEYTILPSTWHDTGVSLWGQAGAWRYEAQVIAGLDGFMFDRDYFVHYGAKSPYEYKVANNLGYVLRVDNHSMKNLRIGLSGYYGHAMHNSFPNDIHGTWCRTTPLWGRGLSALNTGKADRLHDCRARNTLEAIMWHAYSKMSDAFKSAEKFFNLSKEDRDAVVKFVDSI